MKNVESLKTEISNTKLLAIDVINNNDDPTEARRYIRKLQKLDRELYRIENDGYKHPIL
jgi:hypothetical protein